LRAEALRPLGALSRFAEVRFFQHLRGFIKTAGEDLLLAVQSLLRIRRFRAGGVLIELVHQLAVQPGVVQTRQNVALRPEQIDHGDTDNAVLFRFKRSGVHDGQQRTNHPDHRRKRRYAEEAPQNAVGQMERSVVSILSFLAAIRSAQPECFQATPAE
jgi:hypothetical protein